MIEFLVDRKRTALALLLVLICAGIFGRINIPIENEPEIIIPVVYVGINWYLSSRCGEIASKTS